MSLTCPRVQDLRSRGGRLTADIQAVIATDYIRNLRDEARKGIYGRLKQGVYPRPAPLGYRDVGAGQPKAADVATSPFVRLAFELYVSGRYGLDDLTTELNRRGMRTKTGKPIRSTALSDLLNNPFYIGIMRLKRTGEVFRGAHEPLISGALFDRVQRILRGKTQGRTSTHEFLFRRLLKCRRCGYSLIGERQKGHVYYRCHASACRGTSIREEAIGHELDRVLKRLQFGDAERQYFATYLPTLRDDSVRRDEEIRRGLSLQLTHIADRLNRLTDAYLDGLLERDAVETRKAALLMERRGLEDQLAELERESRPVAENLSEFLELAGNAYSAYNAGMMDEKREIVENVTSNREVDGKHVVFTLAIAFNAVAERAENPSGGAHRDTPRTCRELLDKLILVFRRGSAALPNRRHGPAEGHLTAA